MRIIFAIVMLASLRCVPVFAQEVGIWMRFEEDFTSAKDFRHPLYDQKFRVQFVSPTGRIKNIEGFWDGERSWKVRFMPDEKGVWRWTTEASDESDTGLNGRNGSFTCNDNNSSHAIYRNGMITRRPGTYHLEHADGTPFFWTACTAWNGTLKSTDEEWAYYLNHRSTNHYNVIQFVTTQWRGGDKNSMGLVAFEGSGVININPDFFKHLDKKIDQINEAGLVAAPVLLWALQAFTGRYLSPGYYLPDAEAIALAKYMVARYGSHHVVWILGGDGVYVNEYEQRWKNIGRGVFGNEHPGLVALHPSGKSWIGEAYASEAWLDIVGYQSGHNRADVTLDWITKGPAATTWHHLPARPLINMEPVYEEIRSEITAQDIRNACYWSLLSTPTSGITYGATGIWPWLREGEEILNHAYKGEGATRWRESLALPGSMQLGYMAAFFRRLEWWKLKPSPELLLRQPGDSVARHFISVSRTDDRRTIVAYVPSPRSFELYNAGGNEYEAQWFDPVLNKNTNASVSNSKGILKINAPPGSRDFVLVLQQKQTLMRGKKR